MGGLVLGDRESPAAEGRGFQEMKTEEAPLGCPIWRFPVVVERKERESSEGGTERLHSGKTSGKSPVY